MMEHHNRQAANRIEELHPKDLCQGEVLTKKPWKCWHAQAMGSGLVGSWSGWRPLVNSHVRQI